MAPAIWVLDVLTTYIVNSFIYAFLGNLGFRLNLWPCEHVYRYRVRTPRSSWFETVSIKTIPITLHSSEVLMKIGCFWVAVVITFHVLLSWSITGRTLVQNNLQLILVLKWMHFKILNNIEKMDLALIMPHAASAAVNKNKGFWVHRLINASSALLSQTKSLGFGGVYC